MLLTDPLLLSLSWQFVIFQCEKCTKGRGHYDGGLITLWDVLCRRGNEGLYLTPTNIAQNVTTGKEDALLKWLQLFPFFMSESRVMLPFGRSGGGQDFYLIFKQTQQ